VVDDLVVSDHPEAEDALLRIDREHMLIGEVERLDLVSQRERPSRVRDSRKVL
jgi:hypothetical protein